MSLESVTDPQAVPLGLLRRYLTARGWRPATGGRRQLPSTLVRNQAITDAFLQARPVGRRNFDTYVLSEEGLEDVEVVLPRDETASDFLRRIEGAIRTLSDVEGREPDQVITSVRMIGYDVVQSRIPDALVRDGTINLQSATNYLTGLKSLLAATAMTEIQPEPFFLRVKKEADEYANRCRFAHTFRGSFGFSIESPVAPNSQLLSPQIGQARPFERRVMERFARGVRAVCEAVALDTPTRIITDVKTGFSANACEQLADLIEYTSPSGLFISFAFSPEWQTAGDLLEGKDFSIGPRHVEMTRAAAKELRQPVQPRIERIVGRVVRLESKFDPSDLLNPKGNRAITIQVSNQDLSEVLVRVALSPADYLQAHAAHGAGKAVMVSGTLERNGKVWVLANPTDFRMLQS